MDSRHVNQSIVPLIKCGFCLESFDTRKKLTLHKRNVHYERAFEISSTSLINTNTSRNPSVTSNTQVFGAPTLKANESIKIDNKGKPNQRRRSTHQPKNNKRLTQRRMFMCQTCGKTLWSLQSFRDHQNLHSGFKPFSCVKCSRKFYSRKALRNHQRISGRCTCVKERRNPELESAVIGRPEAVNVSGTYCELNFTPKNIIKTNQGASSNKLYVLSSSMPQKSGGKNLQRVGGGKLGKVVSNFKCTTCSKLLRSKVTYDDHLNLHSGSRPHVCPSCSQRFYSNRRLQEHVKHCEFKGNEIKVETNAKLRRDIIKPEMAKSNPNLEYGANQRLISQSGKQNVQFHPGNSMLYQPQPRIAVDAESRHSYGVENFSTTLGRKISDFMCPDCKKLLTSATALADHLRTHTGETSVCCPFCQNNFRSYRTLLTHQKTKACKNARRRKSYCNMKTAIHPTKIKRTLPDASTKRLHKKICSGTKVSRSEDNPVNENLVGKTESLSSTNIKEESNTGLKCPHCEKLLSSKYLLKLHIRLHTGERPCQCEFCYKRFHSSKTLGGHRQVCSSRNSKIRQNIFRRTEAKKQQIGRPSSVKKIGSGISFRGHQINSTVAERLSPKNRSDSNKDVPPNNYESKQTYSEAEKKLIENGTSLNCPYCQRLMCAKVPLLNHMRIHTGERPHKCSRCNNAFYSKHSMYRHIAKCARGNVIIRPSCFRIPKNQTGYQQFQRRIKQAVNSKDNLNFCGKISHRRRSINGLTESKTSTDMNNRNRKHIKVAEDSKKCPFCDYTSSSENLLKHIQTVHLNLRIY